MDVFLERQYKKDCTLGRFWVNDTAVYTLELPWKNNQSGISCIPEGVYNVEKTYSPAFKKQLWLIKDVPNRSGIRIHATNYVRELKGCIAPGLEMFDIDGDGIIDVSKSNKALDLLYTLLPDKFKIEIIENSLLNF